MHLLALVEEPGALGDHDPDPDQDRDDRHADLLPEVLPICLEVREVVVAHGRAFYCVVGAARARTLLAFGRDRFRP